MPPPLWATDGKPPTNTGPPDHSHNNRLVAGYRRGPTPTPTPALHVCRQQSYLFTGFLLSPLFLSHFPAPVSSLWPRTQPNDLPLLTTDLSRPNPTLAVVAIVAGDSHFSNCIFPLSSCFLDSRWLDIVDRHHHHLRLVLLSQSRRTTTPATSPLAIFGNRNHWPVWCPSA